jgi:glycosyltransferase involved in cell wall biosynthesis
VRTRPEAPEVWIVSELYYPEETSTGYFVTGIAEGLAQTFRTAVLCARPTYAARTMRVASRERRGEVDVIRLWSTRLDSHALLPRICNALTVTASAFVATLRRFRRGQVVIVVTNPPTLPFVTLLACKLRGAHCILLVHDVYPDVAAASGLLRYRSITYRLLDALARRLYRAVDRVVVLGRDMDAVVRAKIGGDRPEISIVPNWGDVTAVSGDALRERLGLRGKFVLQYSGNIGRTHDLSPIVDAAEQLRDGAVHVLIVGEGAGRDAVAAEIAKRRATNVTLLPPVRRDELPELLAACDVALISLKSGMAGLSVPSRIYNILAAGKPVIGMVDPRSEIAAIIREEQVGTVVDPGDAAGLVAAIEQARSDPAALAAQGRRALAAAQSRYSRPQVAGAFREIVEAARRAP